MDIERNGLPVARRIDSEAAGERARSQMRGRNRKMRLRAAPTLSQKNAAPDLRRKAGSWIQARRIHTPIARGSQGPRIRLRALSSRRALGSTGKSDFFQAARGVSGRGVQDSRDFSPRRKLASSVRPLRRIHLFGRYCIGGNCGSQGGLGLKSLALANQKGGVGKTTTAVHLAHGLALTGQTVALFDMDPQGHATLALQGMTGSGEETAPPPFHRLQALTKGLWILPSPGATRNMARDASLNVDGLVGLAEDLEKASLDWLIVDCPPRMDRWGWAGLRVCEQVLVPVQAEFFAMHSLSQMMRTMESAREEFPSRAGLLGVVVTMLDEREPVELAVLGNLPENLGPQLLETVVYRDSQLVEAASQGLTLFQYNPFSKGARSYGELVREVVHGRTKVG